MSESVQSAVIDGKQQIDELSAKVEKLERENGLLKENYLKSKTALILEEKTKNLQEKRRDYIKRVLGDKTPKFIEENFDYVTRLFDKAEKGKLKVIKEEAIEQRKHKPDFVKTPEKVVAENVNNNDDTFDPYVSALSQVRKFSK